MAQSSAPVRLRLAEFDRITASRGWTTDAERCRQLGISQTTLSLIRKGDQNVGSRVIHKIMTRLEEPYLALFERVVEHKEVA